MVEGVVVANELTAPARRSAAPGAAGERSTMAACSGRYHGVVAKVITQRSPQRQRRDHVV
jgi:hypothetical protein